MLYEKKSAQKINSDKLISKKKEERKRLILKILTPYLKELITLTDDIKKSEGNIIFYNLKLQKIKDEYTNIKSRLLKEENNLIESYISFIEKEEFYLSPSRIELKDLAEKARDRKLKLQNLKNEYETDKMYMDSREEDLKNIINNLPEDEHTMYQILKDYILNDKDLTKIKNDFELYPSSNVSSIILQNSKTFFREAKKKLKDKKNEINRIRDEIKNMYDKKAQRSLNHLNYFHNNISMIANNTNYINTLLDNSNNNSFFLNYEITRTNESIQNNPINNLNKTFYLRTYKNFYCKTNAHNNRNYALSSATNTCNNIYRNNTRLKSYSSILNTDSSGRFSIHNNKNAKICKRLLKNYCNKCTEKNKEFIFDLKLREINRNNSMPKSLYQQRRLIRENIDDYIYINGKKFKQSLIGKAINKVNGVY